MNRNLVIPMLIFTAFSQAALITTNHASAKTANVMVCRGRGYMHSKYIQGNNFHQLTINFNKAKKSFKQQPPSSGECTWMSSSISTREPSKMVWEPKSFDRDTSELLKLVNSNSLFYVRCYNFDNKHFIIKNVGR